MKNEIFNIYFIIHYTLNFKTKLQQTTTKLRFHNFTYHVGDEHYKLLFHCDFYTNDSNVFDNA